MNTGLLAQLCVVFAIYGLAGSLTGCGTEAGSTLDGGSWGGSVGGTLFDADPIELSRDFASADFYMITKNIGFGIVHEFVGVKLNRNVGPASLLTSGLVADDDAAYFEKVLQSRVPFKSIEALDDLYRIKLSTDVFFKRTWYQNDMVFFGGMVATPIIGRPCAKVARIIYEIILKTPRAAQALHPLPNAETKRSLAEGR